jgi:hypothetical protein
VCRQPAKNPVHALLSNSLLISLLPAAAGPPVVVAAWNEANAGEVNGWISIVNRAERSNTVPAEIAFWCCLDNASPTCLTNCDTGVDFTRKSAGSDTGEGNFSDLIAIDETSSFLQETE